MTRFVITLTGVQVTSLAREANDLEKGENKKKP
jgi:hypothetical protein